MKKFFATMLLAVAISATAFATPKKVNSAILSNFHSEFKKASDVSWVITNEYTKAVFTVDNSKMEVFYNSEGEVIGTSKSITLDQLPVSAKRPFAKRFAGYNVKEAIRFESLDEKAFYISGENEKEFVILKVNDNSLVSLFKRVKK